MYEVLRFEPIYQGRIWGGRRLESAFGRVLPDFEAIGESWDIVDRPEAQSVIRGGALAGRTLRQAIEADPTGIMGPKWSRDRVFQFWSNGWIVGQRLSLQVHPPAAIAAGLRGEPKTENWYVADTEDDSALLVGLRPGVNRARFEQALANGTIEACVRRLPVSAGDSILVESGTVHAIDAGCLILEIQQNSDTTFRVFDWDRVGADGNPRALHVKESLVSMLWSGEEPDLIRGAETNAVIADAREFRIRRILLAEGETLAFAAGEQPRLLSCVSGAVQLEGAAVTPLAAGKTCFCRMRGAYVPGDDPAVLLLTENFV